MNTEATSAAENPRRIKWLRISFSAIALVLCGITVAVWLAEYDSHLQGHLPYFDDVSLSSGHAMDDSPVDTVTLSANWAALPTQTQWEMGWGHIGGLPPPFEFRIDGSNIVVTLPHVLLIVLFGLFVVLPSIPWSNRFNLRTLFIVMTLVAIVLGVGARARTRWQVRKSTIEHLRELAGDGDQSYCDSSGMDTRQFIGFRHPLDDINRIVISLSRPTQHEGKTGRFERLRAFPKLQRLSLGGPGIDDECLAEISQLKSLETLTLEDSHVTDEAFASFPLPQSLRNLELSNVTVTEKALTHLVKLKLEALSISRPLLNSTPRIQLSRTGLRTLSQLTTVRALDLSGCTLNREQTIDYSIGDALESLTRLEALVLSEVTLSDDDVLALSKLTRLRRLDLFGTGASAAVLSELSFPPNLACVAIDCEVASDNVLQKLAGLKRLQHLHIVRAGTSIQLEEVKLSNDTVVQVPNVTADRSVSVLNELLLARPGLLITEHHINLTFGKKAGEPPFF